MDRLSNPKAEQVAAFGNSQRTASRLNQVVPSQSQDTLPTGNEAANHLDHQKDHLRLNDAPFENPREAPPPPTQESSQQQPQGPPPRSPGSNTSSAGTLDPARPPADPPVDPNGPPPPPEDPTQPPSWGSQVVTAFKQSFRVVFCMANHLSEGSVPIELQPQPQAQPVEEVPVDGEPPQTLRQKMRGFFKFGKKASQGNEAQGGQVQGGPVQGRKGEKAKKNKKGAEVSVVPVGQCPNCSGTGAPSGPGNA
ncbi:hypothetical protein F5X68DRAFT_32099 [Plectosphaerella plurivora]|uniref:Uncharacterized protein n=1 Tax=Plectosphaerella plurivora TaxID=936078 RepID=A0A9P8VMB2_9PEZI|nr:hypothetical protein F5X68DRAFT_32099 [Plectosphaerella plurivora]